MTDNTQELQRILTKLARETTLADRAADIATTADGVKDASKRFQWSIGEAKQAILDWHNKRELQVRIEARIEEIEHVADYTNGMTHQMFENLKFRIAELEAERDRLNPSKSTPFNKLKEAEL